MRRFDGLPALVPLRTMRGDALSHLNIVRLRCRHIDPWRRQRLDQFLGVAALARACATENEGDGRRRSCGQGIRRQG